jgi:hypothetical protein
VDASVFGFQLIALMAAWVWISRAARIASCPPAFGLLLDLRKTRNPTNLKRYWRAAMAEMRCKFLVAHWVMFQNGLWPASGFGLSKFKSGN